MSASNDKFISLLGFARRAGKVKFGLDDLKKTKGVKLYAVCMSASDNLVSDMKALSTKTHKPLVIAKRESFTEGNCKAIGIADGSIADGMLEYIKDAQEYEIYRFTEDR